MRRKLPILAIFVLAVSLTGVGSWIWLEAADRTAEQPDSPPLVHATAAEVDLLQAQAAAACRCARRRHEGAEQSPCYAEYRRNLARYAHEEWSNACMPISQTDDCFRLDGGRQRCITRDWGGDACSVEEARTLEAIDAEEQRHPTPGRNRWAEAVQSFIRGERVEAPRHGVGGCSG